MISDLIAQLRASATRLSTTLSGLSDAAGRAPSTLPGWSRTHVVGHLIQSVHAYAWLTVLASDGAEPGPRASREALDRELAEHAARPLSELAPELSDRLAFLLRTADAMPEERWQTLVHSLAGWRHPAWYTLHRCLRELETHHVDLAAAYTSTQWPAPYVTWALDDTISALGERGFPIARVETPDLGRVWDLPGPGSTVSGPGHAVLAWLSGRSDGAGLSADALPTPPVWPMPPAPGWG